MSRPPHCFRYGRHSTAGQTGNNSEDEQQSSTLEWFHREWEPQDYIDAGWFYDAAQSGGKPLLRRPAFNQVFQQCKEGDIVLVTDVDRMSRDTVDGLTVRRILVGMGCDMRDPGSRDWDEDEELVFTVKLGAGTHQRRKAGKKTAAVAKRRRSIGQPNGRGCSTPPFGYYWRKTLDSNRRISPSGATVKHYTYTARPEPTERRIIREFAERIRDGETVIDVSLNALRRPDLYKKGHFHRTWNERNVRMAIRARALGYPTCAPRQFPHLASIATAVQVTERSVNARSSNPSL